MTAQDPDHDSGCVPASHAAAAPTPTLRAEVLRICGLDVARCYQCGKCSAGCPMAVEMPLRPHEMVRLVQLDLRGRLLPNEAPWLCLGCETCTTRCPNGFDPAMVVDAVREIALEEHPEAMPRRIAAFHGAFLDQIRSHGRVFELGLVVSYKLRSGALFDDVAAAPGLLLRGKLGFSPQRIKGIEDVRRIFDACEAEEPKP
jgi:heterodisulfide reductase subunit C